MMDHLHLPRSNSGGDVFKEEEAYDHPSTPPSRSPSPSASSSSFSSCSSSSFLSSSHEDPASVVVAARWATAEQAACDITSEVHPTCASHRNRLEIFDYVQTLITSSFGCQVFPYGSFPLKTYLPDGDIDLTAFVSTDVEETLAHDISNLLKREELNEDALYKVKDVQYIGSAEVRIVKCLVQNVIVDISVNQLGGLGTLCFLEQVDYLVGKDHLFKRSIILIKAWCYYESRILGAHHGLLSTYALETLVLYIFHVYHSSLEGPLAVLYRFLDFFSNFDWENYCISLSGPVRRLYLPELGVKPPEDAMDDLLLSKEFLRSWVDMVPDQLVTPESSSRGFPPKYLNIIDPLKNNNNLGRSVSKGNFYRICSAFRYAARKLGHILLLPKERIPDELCNFFENTLLRFKKKIGRTATGALISSIKVSENTPLPPFAISCSGDASDCSYQKIQVDEDQNSEVRDSPGRSFVDLTGDYEGQISSLLFGQLSLGLPVCGAVLQNPASPSKLPQKDSWDTTDQSLQKPNLEEREKSRGAREITFRRWHSFNTFKQTERRLHQGGERILLEPS